jgi:hypothetical protein
MNDLQKGFDFAIDNGELFGIDPATIFTMGVEWGLHYPFLKTQTYRVGESITIHNENMERFVKMCRENGYSVDVESITDQWCCITLTGLEKENAT